MAKGKAPPFMVTRSRAQLFEIGVHAGGVRSTDDSIREALASIQDRCTVLHFGNPFQNRMGAEFVKLSRSAALCRSRSRSTHGHTAWTEIRP